MDLVQPKIANHRVSRRALWIPLVLGFLITFAIALQLLRLLSVTDKIQADQRILTSAQLIEREVLDLETGLRGYVITRDRTFLAPYEISSQTILPLIRNFIASVPKGSVQYQAMSEVHRLLGQWLLFANDLLSANPNTRNSAMMIASGNGKRLVDQIRAQISVVLFATERHRDETLGAARAITTLFIVVSLGSIFLLAALIFKGLRSQEQSEDAVRESEERLRTLFNSATDAIVVVDRKGFIQMVNPQVQRLFGSSPDELIGEKAERLIPGLGSRRFEASDAKITSSGLELQAKRKDGSLFPVDIALGQSQNGPGVLMTAIVRDITDRKAAEDEQRLLVKIGRVLSEAIDLQSRLEKAAAILVEGVADWCVVDLLTEDGGIRRTAVAARDPSKQSIVERLRAYVPSEARIKGVLKCIRDQEPHLAKEVNLDEIAKQINGDREIMELFRSMQARSYMILPLTARGRPLGAVSLVSRSKTYDDRDLQCSRRVVDVIALATDNARLYEEANQAVLAREDVLAIVSHDLKNPVTSLKLSLQLLRKSVQAPRQEATATPPYFFNLIRSMEYSVNQAFALISDLLDAGKVEAGRFAVEPTALDPVSLIHEAVDAFFPRASELGVLLSFRELGHLPLVSVDGPRVIQVLSNLIGNALKFAQKPGKVEIEIEDYSEREIVVRVKDNGPGIPGDVLPHLFQRYWQPERTRRQGTGLGLFITKGIVEAHGGRIWVESKVGEGAIFSFTLLKAVPAKAELAKSA